MAINVIVGNVAMDDGGMARSTTNPSQSESPAQPISVLLVDDNQAVLKSIRLMLEFDGFNVTGAVDRMGAMKLIDDGFLPDVLVCDFQLADGDDGIQVISYIRRTYSEALPTIVLTGDPSKLLKRDDLPDGAKILCKPNRPGELESAIRDVVSA